MSIPSPTGFLVLKVRRILVHVFLASHSSSEGFGEFHGVSGDGVDVFLGGFIVMPLRYPVIPFSAVIDRILLF